MMQQKKSKTKYSVRADLRRRDLAKIHIAKKQLGMSDTIYREMLKNVAGVASAADLDGRGRLKVLAHLRNCGFKPVYKHARPQIKPRPAAKEREPLLLKVRAILTDLRLPWKYADSMAKRMFKVDRVHWLEPDQLHKLTIALIYHQKRTQGDAK
jgi:phage gp16-like protein